MKKCVFAGTFDPPTTGHKRVIDICLELFDEVIVAVMVNTHKQPLLTERERAELLKKLYKDERRVRVEIFEGAAVDLLERENTPFYVRGIRNTVDFEYENADFFASKKLKDDLVEIYIPAEQDAIQISSTLVKNSVKFNKTFAGYLPDEIYEDFLKLIENKQL